MSISDDLLKTLVHSYVYVFFQKQSLLKWYPCLAQVINFYSVAYLLFMVKIQQNIDIYYLLLLLYLETKLDFLALEKPAH